MLASCHLAGLRRWQADRATQNGIRQRIPEVWLASELTYLGADDAILAPGSVAQQGGRLGIAIAFCAKRIHGHFAVARHATFISTGSCE
jgi:hypothetical protein